jgi:hypothetical protein
VSLRVQCIVSSSRLTVAWAGGEAYRSLLTAWVTSAERQQRIGWTTSVEAIVTVRLRYRALMTMVLLYVRMAEGLRTHAMGESIRNDLLAASEG